MGRIWCRNFLSSRRSNRREAQGMCDEKFATISRVIFYLCKINQERVMMIRITGAVVLFGVCQLAMATPDIKEGLWEITSKIDMPNLPIAMPATTITQCITRQDLVPQSSMQSGGCNVDHNVKGNVVTWRVNCQTDSGQMQGNGKITYQNDSFSGEFVSQMPDSAMGAMQMTIQMNGRYVGACQ